MQEVVEQERAVAKREKQSFILVDEVSKKTAELVINQENSFTVRTVGALKEMTDEFASLRSAITKEVLSTPTDDDAKRGENKPLPSGAEKSKGKELVLTSSESSPPQSKLPSQLQS